MTGKHILKSKTFWANLIALAAFIIQSQFGFVVDIETQGGILAVINIFLRTITTEPVRATK